MHWYPEVSPNSLDVWRTCLVLAKDSELCWARQCSNSFYSAYNTPVAQEGSAAKTDAFYMILKFWGSVVRMCIVELRPQYSCAAGPGASDKLQQLLRENSKLRSRSPVTTSRSLIPARLQWSVMQRIIRMLETRAKRTDPKVVKLFTTSIEVLACGMWQ